LRWPSEPKDSTPLPKIQIIIKNKTLSALKQIEKAQLMDYDAQGLHWIVPILWLSTFMDHYNILFSCDADWRFQLVVPLFYS